MESINGKDEIYFTFRLTFHLKRPTGEIRSISMIPSDMLEETFIVVQHPVGQPESSKFISLVESEEDLFQDFFHFYISTAHNRSKCRGCGSSLLNNLSISTQLICILFTWNTNETMLINKIIQNQHQFSFVSKKNV